MNNFIAFLSVSVSVFTLMAVSIDRYIAIVYPLKPRMSKTCARVVLLAIWVGSGLLSLPSILYSATYTVPYDNGENITVCLLHWPDGPPAISKQDYMYVCLFGCVQYIIAITTVYLYL